MAIITNIPRFSIRQLLLLVAVVAIGAWIYRSFHPLGPLLALLYGLTCIALVAITREKMPLAAACVLAGIIVGFMGFPMVMMSAHPVPGHLLNRVQPGMTQAEVERLLGTPARKNDYDWEYGGFTFCHITIRFTSDGKVDYVVHDH